MGFQLLHHNHFTFTRKLFSFLFSFFLQHRLVCPSLDGFSHLGLMIHTHMYRKGLVWKDKCLYSVHRKSGLEY
ncbi:hypothetical protein BDV25DRAFT_158742 [Aspergillus avenaceus]|uniref:Uncharacterized protein n=1 Tax=Aspergillus avenaceus TaxID=36643 RepID=A0A5N6TQ35_ASPAV|nr:hypothetical protein BDV25DRAFT_158742 [Aspergillus avenaceus]